MSRLTSAQVISLGEYLDPEFDPSTLTVSQLLGVLGYHNIPYPTPYTKSKLIQVFNNEVKTRAKKFQKDRVKKENSIASEEGIMDGVTGQPLSKSTMPAPVARRTSRRLSQLPREEESSPTRPDPPKRRRSSAQPTLGGPSKRTVQPQVQVTVIEESEPEEEIEMPVRKAGRTKKLTSPGIQGRRASHISGGEDSGWEDNNIFQSGAESSSPARPSPVRPRVSRTGGLPRKSRKSTSAPPPQIFDSPFRSTNLPDNIPRSPPQSPFRPALPALPTYDFTQTIKQRFTPIREFSPAEPSKRETSRPLDDNQLNQIQDFTADDQQLEAPQEYDSVKAEEGVESLKDSESQIDEAISRLMSEEINDLDVETATPVDTSSPGNRLARAMVWCCILASLFGVCNYKVESSSIGFCDRGSNTSNILETILYERRVKEACQRRMALVQDSSRPQADTENTVEDCGFPPLIPVPHPGSCTTCPDHASCTQHGVVCDSGYLLKPHVLLSFIPVVSSTSSLSTAYVPQLSEAFFKAVSLATDGLPGLGSVAFPPRCLEDPQRRRHIGAMGKSIESKLAKERGKRICRGDNIHTPAKLEAITWGVEEHQLREVYRHNTSPKMLPQFDDMFNEAIQQLTQWGGVIVGESEDGKRYIANKTPEMSWRCILIVKSREAWSAWRTTVLASIFTILSLLGARFRMTQRQKENRRIAGLVQVALDTLRNQEMAHYTDPLTAPQPYLSSIQLRDLVLQEEHSVPTRRRLWEQVERVVESNANVRANLEEIEGGDETRVWRWVGSSGRTPGRKRFEVEAEAED